MKINFFISSLSGGGAERVLVTIAKKIAEQGNSVKIFSLEKRPQFYDVDTNVTLFKIDNNNRFGASLRDLFSIRKVIKKHKADVNISFLSRCNILVLIACLFTKNKVIVCDRNNPKKEHSSFSFFITNLLYKRANVINVQTEQAKTFYSKKIQKKISVIENPLDTEHLQGQISECPERKKIILSMGRLENQKDFKTLISAFAKIAKDFPDWVLNIFGKGENKQKILDFIKEKGLQEQIFLNDRTKKPFYEMSRSNIFVLSSFYEGFPNVLCEAMYAGCLCISSNCDCGPRELIKHGENGWLFPVQNVDSLANVLKNTIMNNNELEQVRHAAQNTVKRLYVDSIVTQWINMIRKLVEK